MPISIKTKKPLKLDELARLIFEKYSQGEAEFHGFYGHLLSGDLEFEVSCPYQVSGWINFKVRG